MPMTRMQSKTTTSIVCSRRMLQRYPFRRMLKLANPFQFLGTLRSESPDWREWKFHWNPMRWCEARAILTSLNARGAMPKCWQHPNVGAVSLMRACQQIRKVLMRMENQNLGQCVSPMPIGLWCFPVLDRENIRFGAGQSMTRAMPNHFQGLFEKAVTPQSNRLP